MFEQRNRPRVSSALIEMKIEGTPIVINDISQTGVRVQLPKGELANYQQGVCKVIINYTIFTLPYRFHDDLGDAQILVFIFSDPAVKLKFRQALKHVGIG